MCVESKSVIRAYVGYHMIEASTRWRIEKWVELSKVDGNHWQWGIGRRWQEVAEGGRGGVERLGDRKKGGA